MEIKVNGQAVHLERECTVSELIGRLALTGRLAVEINRQIVPRSEFDSILVQEGDSVEIVRAIGGG
jgi:sulfur carrier protein